VKEYFWAKLHPIKIAKGFFIKINMCVPIRTCTESNAGPGGLKTDVTARQREHAVRFMPDKKWTISTKHIVFRKLHYHRIIGARRFIFDKSGGLYQRVVNSI